MNAGEFSASNDVRGMLNECAHASRHHRMHMASLQPMRALRTLCVLTPSLIVTAQATESSKSCPTAFGSSPSNAQARTSTQQQRSFTPTAAASRNLSYSSKPTTLLSTTMLNDNINNDGSSLYIDNDDNNDDLVQQCIQRLQESGIRVVIFDMDLTIVNQHSRGQLQRGAPLEAFLAKVTPDFKRLVPELYKQGFSLAIATHSDEKEVEYNKYISKETHILGEELATTVLQRYFSPEIAESFYIVAYNPYAHLSYWQTLFGGAWAKRHHMKLIQDHYQAKPEEMVMIDDMKPIVRDCIKNCGVQAIHVSPLTGFTMKAILDNLL